MSDTSDRTLEFQCPKCAKKLRASLKAAGKRLQCPGCNQPVKVPGPNPVADQDDDWLNLDEPVAPAPPKSVETKSPPPKSRALPNDGSVTEPTTKSSSSKATPSTTPGRKEPSVFDDDLPELAELEPPKPRTSMASILGVDDIDDLVPVKPTGGPRQKSSTGEAGKSSASKEAGKADSSKGESGGKEKKKKPAIDPATAQYRCACPSCGTPQYVTLAKQGKMVRCPDCFIEFKIPPPPPGWTPTQPATTNWGTDLVQQTSGDTQQYRNNANDLLRQAEQDLEDKDIDSMYDTDFDTASFARRTFGFVFDAPAMFQICLFSLMFALLFAADQFCLNQAENKVYLLFAGLLIPLLGIIVAFPMFGAAIAILESVANGQSKVREWQGFNFFDHLGEMMLFAIAMGASAGPGFLIGGLIGNAGGNALLVVFLTMVTSFVAFPIILLSLMDNESLVNPFSPDVFKSLSVGFEAWGTYYFKTFGAYFIVFVIWSLTLARTPVLAAIGGLFFPLLFFFTIQQLGVLAFDISEHLSIIVPDKKDDEEDEKVEQVST